MSDITDLIIRRFPNETELDFQRWYDRFTLPLIKVSIPIATVLCIGFFLWDALFSVDHLILTFGIRFSVALFVWGTYIVLYTNWGENHSQALLTTAGGVGALGVATVLYVTPGGFVGGVAGMCLVTMIVCCFFFLRFTNSIIFNALLVVICNAYMAISRYDFYGVANANFFLMSFAATGIAYNYMFELVMRNRFQLENALAVEKAKASEMLHQLMPDSVVSRLSKGEQHIADSVSDATILFADIVGFTALAGKVSPGHLVEILSKLFSRFDQVADAKHLEQIKTIGDGYMLAGGVPVGGLQTAEDVIEFAKEAIAIVREFGASANLEISVRIGIATGSVVCGVLGTRKPIFDIWGETVNLAARIQAKGAPNRILVSESTYYRVRKNFDFEPATQMELHGIGSVPVYALADSSSGKTEASNVVELLVPFPSQIRAL